MNTSVYYIFLYVYACITNDFCSEKLRNDRDFRRVVLRIWDLLCANGENEWNKHIVPRKFIEVNYNELSENDLDELKKYFKVCRKYWGSLPQDFFSNGCEDKVSRLLISCAIFKSKSSLIDSARSLLNDPKCTNSLNRIHVDCLSDFGKNVLGDKTFVVERGLLDFKRPGIHITLINGHFIPYYINAVGVYVLDLEMVLPKKFIDEAFNRLGRVMKIVFLPKKIDQLGEECALHSISCVLYKHLIEINPFFIWFTEISPNIDYKSYKNIKNWFVDHGIDHQVLLRAQEYVSYRIF